MALNATIYKVDLQVSDTDRHYYSSHAITVARHPSETNERMMARLIAFALHADENLAFTKGLSQADEPDIWLKDLTGAIDLWIEVGQPTETRLLKACGRASQVLVYCFNGHASQLWWNAIQQKTARASNLKIIALPSDAIRSLASKTERSMALQTTIQDGELFITLDDLSLSLRPEALRDFRP